MEISQRLVSGRLPLATVRRSPAIVCIAVLLNNRRQSALIDVSGWEVGLAEVGCLVGVVEVKVKRLCNLVICAIVLATAHFTTYIVADLRCCRLEEDRQPGFVCEKLPNAPKMTTEGCVRNLLTFCSTSSSTDLRNESYAGYLTRT